MGTNVATRLTSFALITAIEQDLRAHVAARAGQQLATIIVGDVEIKSSRRFSEAVGITSREADASLLLDFCDFADLAVLLREVQKLGLGSGNEDQVAKLIERVSPGRNRVCHGRPLEPEDFPALMDLVEVLESVSLGIEIAHLRAVRKQLEEDPASVFALEIPTYWRDRASRPMHNLPVAEFDDTGFLGRHADRQALRKLILSAHPVVSVIGEGGVGKTALALRCL
jgi:LuxR family transcriptional regulator, glucitol operon activator